jgi:chromosome segregation ATPase
MADLAVNESALQADVEELRKRFPDTKNLYREVAVLLFFRYGQPPTTNRLYQLVRKGSMNTVTTALAAFWTTLRERSRVQIDHPALPDELKAAAGDLVQVLWEKANTAAKLEFEAAASEATASVSAAKQAQAKAEEAFGLAQREQALLGERLKTSAEQLATLQGALETEKREHGATAARLEEARAEVESLRQAQVDARRDFAAELDKAREAVKLAEERLDAAERRAMVEIDRERTLRGDAEKEANRLRTALATAETNAGARAQADATELGQLRGKLQSAEAEVAKRESENALLQKQVTALETIVARSEGEVAATRGHVIHLEDTLRLFRKVSEFSQADAYAAMQAFQNIASQWRLTEKEILNLLGAESKQQITDWSLSIKPIPKDANDRLAGVISIHRWLHTIFSDAAIADAWVRQKNTGKLFGGRRAIDVMLEGGSGLELVRQYLAAEAAGND